MNLLVFMIDKLAGAIVSLPVIMLFLIIFDRKRVTKKWLWAVLFSVYMNAMLVIVGTPYSEYITWKPEINFIPFHDFSPSNILGMSLNVVMLVPFGAFLTIYFKKFSKLAPTVLAGALMSIVIEVLQLFTFRATDIDDLIMNTLGTLVGYMIGRFIIRRTEDAGECDKDVIKLVVMILISILVVVFVNNSLIGVFLDVLGV